MASPTEVCVPEGVQKEVRAVLLSKIGGVPLKQFNNDFKSLIGHPFNWRGLGFSSLIDCVKAMPNVIRIDSSSGETKLYGIGDGTSFMTKSQIKAARGMVSPDHVVKKTDISGAFDGSEPDLSKFEKFLPNLSGLYAVCMKREPQHTEESVRALFSIVGPVETVNFSNLYVFIRYAEKLHACRAIMKFKDIGVTIPVERSARTNSPSRNKNTSQLESSGHPKLLSRGKHGGGKKGSRDRPPPAAAEPSVGVPCVSDDEMPELEADEDYSPPPSGSEQSLPDDSCKLFLGNIPPDFTEASLLRLLSSKRVERVQVVREAFRPYAYAYCHNADNLSSIIQEFNGLKFEGRRLKVAKFVPKAVRREAMFEQLGSTNDTKSKGGVQNMNSDHQKAGAGLTDDKTTELLSKKNTYQNHGTTHNIDTGTALNRDTDLTEKEDQVRNKMKSGKNNKMRDEHGSGRDAQSTSHSGNKKQAVVTKVTPETPDGDLRPLSELRNIPPLLSQDELAMVNGCHSKEDTKPRLAGNEQKMELRLTNFPFGTTERSLMELLQPYNVLKVRIKNNDSKPTIAFADCLDQASASQAISDLNGSYHWDRRLSVSYGSIHYNPERVSQTAVESLQPVSPHVAGQPLPNSQVSASVADKPTPPPTSIDPPITPPSGVECPAGMKSMILRMKTQGMPALPDSLTVLVTSVVDKHHFWGHLLDLREGLEKLSDLMMKIGAQSHRIPLSEGQNRCAALYEEEWCRAWIKEFLPNSMYRVFYPDYGNTAIVSLEEMCEIPNKYWTLPPQAVPFRSVVAKDDMPNVENTIIVVKKVKNNLADKEPIEVHF